MQKLVKHILIILVVFANINNAQGIDIYRNNSSYWEYDGKPILLLGGSSDDNLFQIKNLEDEIKRIKECGGNFVRNTLSCRDKGNVWPFLKDKKSGKYDLNRFNDEFWSRLDNFLRITSENNIIVQMELWATFDYYKDNWNVNPFNPKNNINYNTKLTKLPTVVKTHPVYCDNSFFESVPMLDNNLRVLEFQQKFIDKVMSISLKYNNVLYCIDNETSVSAAWGKFWSEYIRKLAAEKGGKIHVTEMWDPHDLNHITHRETFDHPELYSFVEISQNNHKKGEQHYLNGIKQINRLKKGTLKRPVNNVKVYGSELKKHGHGAQNGKESFIRNIFFGAASSRFHRPDYGIGISEEAQNIIKSTRLLTDSMDIFNLRPGNHLLLNRQENEAYCIYTEKNQYAVFFTGGGSVDLRIEPGRYQIKWLNIENSLWESSRIATLKDLLHLAPRSKEMWFVLIKEVN